MEISEFIEPATKVVEKIVECVQNKKEETCRTDKLWETRDNTLRIHSKLEYQLENLLSPGSIVSTIILSGVGGYGKTTAMHIRFNKEENNRIIYDRRNHLNACAWEDFFQKTAEVKIFFFIDSND